MRIWYLREIFEYLFVHYIFSVSLFWFVIVLNEHTAFFYRSKCTTLIKKQLAKAFMCLNDFPLTILVGLCPCNLPRCNPCNVTQQIQLELATSIKPSKLHLLTDWARQKNWCYRLLKEKDEKKKKKSVIMAEGADVEILTALYIFFFNKIILKKLHKFHRSREPIFWNPLSFSNLVTS